MEEIEVSGQVTYNGTKKIGCCYLQLGSDTIAFKNG